MYSKFPVIEYRNETFMFGVHDAMVDESSQVCLIVSYRVEKKFPFHEVFSCPDFVNHRTKRKSKR